MEFNTPDKDGLVPSELTAERGISRRTVVTTAAWAVPVVALSTSLPAAAASAAKSLTLGPASQDYEIGDADGDTGHEHTITSTGEPAGTPITVTLTGDFAFPDGSQTATVTLDAAGHATVPAVHATGSTPGDGTIVATVTADPSVHSATCELHSKQPSTFTGKGLWMGYINNFSFINTPSDVTLTTNGGAFDRNEFLITTDGTVLGVNTDYPRISEALFTLPGGVKATSVTGGSKGGYVVGDDGNIYLLDVSGNTGWGTPVVIGSISPVASVQAGTVTKLTTTGDYKLGSAVSAPGTAGMAAIKQDGSVSYNNGTAWSTLPGLPAGVTITSLEGCWPERLVGLGSDGILYASNPSAWATPVAWTAYDALPSPIVEYHADMAYGGTIMARTAAGEVYQGTADIYPDRGGSWRQVPLPGGVTAIAVEPELYPTTLVENTILGSDGRIYVFSVLNPTMSPIMINPPVAGDPFVAVARPASFLFAITASGKSYAWDTVNHTFLTPPAGAVPLPGTAGNTSAFRPFLLTTHSSADPARSVLAIAG
jgi:hypothetical protein